MGVSNTLSSIFGGLTIIPGGVKSRVNIDAGGRTLWANFYNAIFLIAFLFLAKDLISRIPLAAIGAILVYVGWRLCEIQVFRKTYRIGRDQITIFVVTIAAILATDLLFGILIGIAAEIMLLVYLLTPSLRAVLTGRITFSQSWRLLWENFAGLFHNPIIKVKELPPGESTGGEHAPRQHYRVSLGSIACFNLLPLDKLLRTLPAEAGITLTVTESGRIIDHTAMEYLHQFQEACLHAGRPFEMLGLENFYTFTPHPLAARMRDAKLVKDKAQMSTREQQMAEVAGHYGFEFAPATVGILNSHDFIYLRRGNNRQESCVMTGSYHGCHIKLFDYSHTAAPDYYAEHRHTLFQLYGLDIVETQLPNLAVTPGDYLERYLVEYQEVDTVNRPVLGSHYRFYAENPALALEFIETGLAQLLRKHPGIYVEIRNNALLVFRPDQALEPPQAIEILLSFAEFMGGVHRPVAVQ
jgi:hypothetical protein